MTYKTKETFDETRHKIKLYLCVQIHNSLRAADFFFLMSATFFKHNGDYRWTMKHLIVNESAWVPVTRSSLNTAQSCDNTLSFRRLYSS